ncbi:uncharacterized protein N7482_002078 [Penicillium canariense]|uniref:AB hydrolase-1 domain-containing protein n=1 Tax=Penicillium canariense TaxID=189055 RepID=A0A9W9IKY7_9EURO|nr:uncharacterized protein N7482_002078 [Penicillium canariense]KAJ5176201.1 hypothetical protein N7482_002078 [Penicillium canariense]
MSLFPVQPPTFLALSNPAMEGRIRDHANRSLSSLSLPRPGGLHGTAKRRLLLIYIHGFMGSEASFHDLPAHIHDLVTGLLSESHVVFTRIYPRYKSHGELQTAVNQFSAWLSPHEADDLDVILLGHSLGGILAADVALLQHQGRPKHHILGLVNFDVPFLGLHPRVIPTGIMGSVPKKDIAVEDQLAGEQESLGLEPAYKPVTTNPNFDPPFMNDVRLIQRGFVKGVMHFVNKNADNLSRSIFDRLVSPVKFAGCVNNYSELRQRHQRLMELEAAEYSPARVRFVNYYTTSTGRIPRKAKEESTQDIADEPAGASIVESSSEKPPERPAENDINNRNQTEPPFSRESSAGQNASKGSETAPSSTSTLALDELSLNSVSSDYTLAAQETSSQKDYPSPKTPSITSSAKLDSKSETLSESVSLSTSQSDLSSETSKRKLRKFILLPSHHWKHNDNSHWTPVLMEDMNEVTAHQSMFVPQGANYDYLVGDTVALIEQWVQSDLSRRLLQESLD